MDVSREDTSCTSTSMYLSFDAESTVSSAAFRTLEASSVSEMEDDASVDHSQESHMNSTLEPKNSSQIPSNGQKTVNRADPAAYLMKVAPSPFPRTFPKNILQEYKALCSTPTKEQLLRNVETVRGSSVEGCLELGMSFLNMDEQKQHMCFPPPLPADENKENAQESEEGSISLVSTSVEIVTSVIEQKITLPTTTDESLKGLDHDNVEIVNSVKDVEEKPQKAKEETKMTKDEAQTLEKDIAAVHKYKRSILAPKNIRKSICEPDLKANRPARILLNAQKRTSLSACPLKANTERDQASEIPKLIDKLLKISDTAKVDEIDAKAQGKVPLNENRKSMVTSGLKPRSSKLPTIAQAEKRPFSFTQRMSIVVKTTLNSPARKIARRSVLPNPQAIRKSILPKTLDAPTTASASTTGIAMRRKSMLPIGKTTTATAPAKATQYGSKENDSKSKLPTTRQSLYPQTKSAATPLAPKLVATTVSTVASATRFKSIDTSKANLSFICSICSSKFSLKSLLNAHLRSHEDGIPTFVKKPLVSNTATTASTQSLLNSENQCKYCDKKFALVRALHIHLLQNCAKIPPKEKRKLQFTELNHVEKAQLPAVFHTNAPQQISNEHSSSIVTTPAASSLSNDTQLMMPPKSRSNVSSATMSSTESLAGKKDITVLANELVAAVDGVLTKMAPPSAPRAKKKTIATAHSGLYRTPTKSVPCHLCKKTFKSILEFTNHSMTLHSTSTYSTTVCTIDNNSSGECGNKSSSSPMDLSSA